MMTIRTMRKRRGDCIVTLDRTTLGSLIRAFTQSRHSIVVFDKEWISEPPFGRTDVSIPEEIDELRISRDLIDRGLGEEIYVNLVEKPRGRYIMKVGPARFESSKQRGMSLDEFLLKWQELHPDEYNTLKGDE